MTPRSALHLVRPVAFAFFGLLAAAAPVLAQAEARQTQEDDYTRYELQAPGSGKFLILYEVTATTPGRPFFFNTIRKGSVATDESVIDVATGEELKMEVVGGAQAQKEGHPSAALDTDYIKVHLRQPVPEGGQVRLLIIKTYEDAKSYYRDGNAIVFDRSLGIRRNSVVLPKGYRLAGLNVPSQIMPTEDGRVMISFMNPGPGAAPLVIRAEPGLQPFTPGDATEARPPAAGRAGGDPERAHDAREAVYDLGDPAAHAFQLQHDYTEGRLGASQYFDVVPDGATVASPSATSLDTGEPLKVDVFTGGELERRGLVPGAPVAAGARVVVVSFAPVPRNGSTRLRVHEAFTDPVRYKVDAGTLAFDAALAAPRATVVLPAGWSVVASPTPVLVSTRPDGRQQLYFENLRPGELPVAIRARQ
ncbi:MAG: hypothetical protein AB7H88_05950 [Vicinamibacterales bacterium]